uniref:DNA-directed DNA polymerase n=1 Tax=Spongospora subterranea TaxID=70186 RepID=A0A0H5QLP7_9EUKA|eukprot:CRZ02928.1 hypothetical protein [Spongospora subterranea]
MVLNAAGIAREIVGCAVVYRLSQIVPPVLRLCAHIEGTDASRLADCLGLDGSKFHNSDDSGQRWVNRSCSNLLFRYVISTMTRHSNLWKGWLFVAQNALPALNLKEFSICKGAPEQIFRTVT